MRAFTNIHAFATRDEIHLSDRFKHNSPHELVWIMITPGGRTESRGARQYPTRVAAWAKLHEAIIDEMDDNENFDMEWNDGQVTIKYDNGYRYVLYVGAI